jgi:hypothetical protein
MTRRSPTTPSSDLPKIDLAQRYLELTRLREAVQEAEGMRAPHAKFKPSDQSSSNRMMMTALPASGTKPCESLTHALSTSSPRQRRPSVGYG